MPSRLADDDELRALVGACGEAGRGVFMLTKGGHTRIAFLEELARDSARRWWSPRCFTTAPIPTRCSEDLDAIAEANARGRRLLGAVSCCPLSMDFTLHSPYVSRGWTPGSRRCRSRATRSKRN
jgi:N-acyl-D-amino-acid deacylase